MTMRQAALTYAEAQLRIDDQSMTDEVTVGLRHLNQLAKILKERRHQNGCVRCDWKTVSFHVSFGHRLHTRTAMPRSTQPSTVHGMVKFMVD